MILICTHYVQPQKERKKERKKEGNKERKKEKVFYNRK